jgi:glycosyltransferase involved in cell wall biosynthesis
VYVPPAHRRLLYFTDSVAYGGAEQVLASLLTGLDRRAWDPLLVHHPEPGLAPLVRHAHALDVRVQVVPRMQGARPAARVQQLAHFVRLVKAEQPAVFHANLAWPLAGKYALLSAALARVPAVVAHEHSLGPTAPAAGGLLLHRLIGRGVDRYVAVSRALADRLRRVYHVPSRKLRVVPNGIAVAQFERPARPRPRLRPMVLTVARLDEVKGHQFLLEAARLVPEATFVLAGEGPERAGLEAQALRLGVADRVSFMGHRSDVPALLASCDVLVLPSLAESSSLTLLEAMAARKPVIATRVGGIPEIVEDGQTGVLVPPADPPALAAAIRSLLIDRDQAGRLASAGRARVQREFTLEAMVRGIAAVYDEALG